MASKAIMCVSSDLDAGYSKGEWKVRQTLASCYHLFDYLGWNDSIFNHISVRVPGADRLFLINPFGLNYAEVTASNLVKVDLDGRAVGQHDVNYAGFLIHSAIHGARDDAHCVMHTHSVAISAVAGKTDGLRHDSFNGALLYGQVAYHEFEGITLQPDEQRRLIESIGDKPVMILRNHGSLVTGPSIEQAFLTMFGLQAACEVQCAVDACAGESIRLPASVLQTDRLDGLKDDGTIARIFFDAAVRRMELARSGDYPDFRS